MQMLHDILKSFPDGTAISEVSRGPHWNAVVSRRCGLASSMPQDACCTGELSLPRPKVSFTEMSALELARFNPSDKIPEASLGTGESGKREERR